MFENPIFCDFATKEGFQTCSKPIVWLRVPYVNPHTKIKDFGVGVNPDSAASLMVFGCGYGKVH